MKKLILILTSVLLLQGCSFSDKQNYSKKVEQYESYYQTVLDNDKFSDSSPYFAIKVDMDKVDEGYVYEIIVDEAKIAMYDVKIMVVENRKDYNDEDKMMPSAGIFDDQVYNVIPNQSRIEKGYMSGFQLLGETNEDAINLEVLVIFNDYRKLNTYREFMEFDLKYGEEIVEEEIKNTEVEDTETEDEKLEGEVETEVETEKEKLETEIEEGSEE